MTTVLFECENFATRGKNISDRQQCAQFLKSKKVQNHSTLAYTVVA